MILLTHINIRTLCVSLRVVAYKNELDDTIISKHPDIYIDNVGSSKTKAVY